jgi:hypothetical protein
VGRERQVLGDDKAEILEELDLLQTDAVHPNLHRTKTRTIGTQDHELGLGETGGGKERVGSVICENIQTGY